MAENANPVVELTHQSHLRVIESLDPEETNFGTENI